ncbi:MAG: hypothetical protein K2G03_01500 [Bacilli bacterium]|nr:hypothetical protein [Bacilli bacterium]
MRIGIDIDGVLTNIEHFRLNYFSKYCVEHNIDYKIGESSYELHEIFNVDKKVTDEFWRDYLFYYAEKENPRPFAKEVIDKLKKNGNEIYIITARWLSNRDDEEGARMRATVKEWLNKHEIYYDKLIFSKADAENKEEEIKEYEIDLMIEDNPANIMELSKFTEIICFDTSYNKECKGEKITRCYSWYDILKVFDDMI